MHNTALRCFIQVDISQTIYSVDSYDDTEGKIITTGNLRLTWVDEFLTWNPSEYGGLDSLVIPRSAPWIPDIAMVRGSINGDPMLSKTDILPVYLVSTGLVYVFPGGNLESMCIVDTFLHPFDVHECEFEYLSAQYTLDALYFNVMEPGIHQGALVKNPEWFVEKGDSTVTEMVDQTYDFRMSKVIMRLALRRRPSFDIIHSYVPSILLFLLNVATCFIPFDTGDRLTFASTLLMSFMFYCSAIIAAFPRNGLTITITSYLIIVVNITNVAGVVFSIFLLRLSRRSTAQYTISSSWLRLVSVCHKEGRPAKCQILACHEKVEPLSESKPAHICTTSQLTTLKLPDEKEKRSLDENTSVTHSDGEMTPDSDLSWHDVAESLDTLYFRVFIIIFIIMTVVWIAILASNDVALSSND